MKCTVVSHYIDMIVTCCPKYGYNYAKKCLMCFQKKESYRKSLGNHFFTISWYITANIRCSDSIWTEGYEMSEIVVRNYVDSVCSPFNLLEDRVYTK